MVTRKENTPQRIANRKYEEKNKDKRKATSGNFQTMIPRELLEKINAFLKEYGYTKVELIQAGYEELLARHNTDFAKLKDGYDDFFPSELEQFKKQNNSMRNYPIGRTVRSGSLQKSIKGERTL